MTTLVPTDTDVGYDADPGRRPRVCYTPGAPQPAVGPGAWACLLGARWRWILAAGVALVWAIGAALPAADTDTGMHLRVGEWIVTHGALPRVEPFAWTRAGAPYFAYSWLAETSYYLAWRDWGTAGLQVLNGVVLLASVLAVAAFARLARHTAWTTALLVVAHVVVLELCAPALRPQQLLAVALPLCWAAAARLATDRSGRWRGPGCWPYVVLVGAAALAANTHLFAPACLAALALVVPSSGWRAASREWRVFAAAAAAIVVGFFCTPYALEWGAIYRLNFAPNALLRFPSPIAELTPGFVCLTGGVSAVWLVAPALALLPWVARPALTSYEERTERDEVVVPGAVPGALLWLAGLLFFGLAVRGIYLWWLVSLPLVAAALAQVPERTPGLLGRVLRAAPLVLLALTAAGNAREWADARRGTWSAHPRFFAHPAAGGALRLADTLDRVAPGGRGRVVTTVHYGNALLWRLPRYSMSVDGRSIFPDSALSLDVIVPASRRADTLRAPIADADLVLLPVGHTGLAQVARSPGWRLVARTRPGPGERGAARDTAEVWAREAWLRQYAARYGAVRR